MTTTRSAWLLASILVWCGASRAAAQPEEEAGASPVPAGETAVVGGAQPEAEPEAEPEAAPKPKAKKKAKTKKETAEERYRRSKYFAIMPDDTESYKFSSEGRASGAPVQKKSKKGKKGAAAKPKKKTCTRTAGITCAPEDECGCCQRRLDCEELPACVWHADAGGADAAVRGMCAGNPEGAVPD
ncbi:MAG: hypothetical protein HY924_16820 [Elusimicrobia bacterium]|nr:hypothetical protein [Elusimicrobiota bacterium]